MRKFIVSHTKKWKKQNLCIRDLGSVRLDRNAEIFCFHPDF